MHGPFNSGPRWVTVNTGLLFHLIFVIIIFMCQSSPSTPFVEVVYEKEGFLYKKEGVS